LETPDGHFAGVMLSGISPLHFVDMFAALANQESTTIILRHVSGAVIASLPSFSTETNISAPPRNDLSIATRRHSLRYPVQVEVVIDLETKLAPWRQERNAALVLALCGSLVIGAGAFSLRRQTLRRRQVLADLAETNARLEQRVQERTAQLQTTANRLQSFLSVAQDAVVVIDHQGLIAEFNPAAQALFGYDEDEVIRHSINMLMPPRYAATHDGYLAHARMQPARTVGRGREMVGLRKDSSEFPIELTVGTHRNGDTMIHVGVIRDITERKQAEARLTHLATIDGLTEMLNRTAFLEQGNRLLAESKGGPLAVLMVDADHFKRVNDTHGHAAGDQVLRHLAAILREAARGADIAGRMGGEEFALILAKAPGNAAERVANQILNRVRATQVTLEDDCVLEFRVSIGIAIGTEADGLEHLLSRADQALYAAKNQGRDRAVLAATD
jgi:diguanylate cyclase (GGDEF)-like protein/PAS domain S-box-containing protein